MQIKLTTVLAATLSIATGCGGTIDRSCDEVRIYQLAQEGKRIAVPEGLDPLDELKEIPLPEASPQAGRAIGSPCLDLPPNILSSD